MLETITISLKDLAMGYEIDLSITLEPSFCNRWPEVRVGIDHITLYSGELSETQTIRFSGVLDEGKHSLWLDYTGKTNADTTKSADQAVTIRRIEIEGLSADRFIWRGVYRPRYPEPWASKQENLAETMTNMTYLGFNGVWRLDFDMPVFTWIHEVEHLGWLYR